MGKEKVVSLSNGVEGKHKGKHKGKDKERLEEGEKVKGKGPDSLSSPNSLLVLLWLALGAVCTVRLATKLHFTLPAPVSDLRLDSPVFSESLARSYATSLAKNIGVRECSLFVSRLNRLRLMHLSLPARLSRTHQAPPHSAFCVQLYQINLTIIICKNP